MGVGERKAREFQRRETEILQAALALSNRDDWQSVTIEQIAEKAEIGKGTVYKHFSSKDEIYASLALRFHGLVLERLRATDATLEPLAALRAIVKAFWDVYATHSEYQRVVDYCERPDFQRLVADETRRQLQLVSTEFCQRIHAAFQRGIDSGLLADRPIPLMLFGAQSALVGALKLLGMDCLPGARAQYLEELTAFILAGLTRPAERRSKGRKPR